MKKQTVSKDINIRISELLNERQGFMGKRKTYLTILSCIVVFITTYVLILPAITLDQDEAARQGGIDVATEQLEDIPVKDPDADSNAKASDSDKSNKIVLTMEPDDLSGSISYSGKGYQVSANCDGAGLPEGTEIVAEEISKSDDSYDGLYEDALKAVQKDSDNKISDFAFAKFYDISLLSGKESIEPDDPVDVTISFDKALKASDAKNVRIVHFAVDKETGEIEPEVLKPNQVDATVKKNKLTEATFEAASFSVYAVVYTVDFHYEANGKTYKFSIPGGGYVTLQQLVEVLGIAEDDASANEVSETEKDTPAETKLTLADVEISDRTLAFAENVEKAEFSDPELAWVGRADEDRTVGELKDANNLECQYSGNLSDEQIDEINAQTVTGGDWALISLRPFTSNEKLTVTMKNGDHFVVKVTDALHVDPDELVGKEIVIYDKTENRALTSAWDRNDYRTQFASIDYSGEGSQTPDNAHWTVEKYNNSYYLKSNGGQYLSIDDTNVYLVNTLNEATALTIQMGGNPDYRIYAQNDESRILRYSENNQYPGFFGAPGGMGGTGNTRQWLGIDYAAKSYDRVGDWLLYFDDDFDEITIHVGETITLRPYNKWEWKEGGVDAQTAHWNVGGNAWSDWSISSSDNNGSKLSTTTDGPFEFTRYVKEDSQLTTHYWSVQGRATQTGDYTLTNTKNGKTITVHVVDGDPVNKPNTINKIANIKVNLFDYDKNKLLDPSDNTNLANNNNNKDDSVNQMGGSNHFYFLSSGSGDNTNEPWNSYTKDASNPDIVKSTLGSDGYPELNNGNSDTSLKYLFDASQTSWHGGNNNDGMIAYPDVVGMFQKDSSGYYYFNSNTNYFYYDTASGTSKLYEHTYTQTSSADKNSLVNDKPIGFFPFHDYDATDDLYVNQNSNLNHHVGMSMDIEFMLSEDRLDDNGKPIIFDFSGDDDLWVFAEWVDDNGQKQSKLLLDLGGVHQPIHGQINFTTGENTQFIQPNKPYTLKVFYLERGGCDSNCSIRFNLPIIQDLAVAKKLTGLTEDEKAKYEDEEFTYEITLNGQPYHYPNPNNAYEKATIWNAAGEDITPANFEIENGRFTLKDGQTLTISYLDRSDKFTVAELNTDNMEYFEVPNAERYYHRAHDASLYEEEIHLTASQTQSEPVTDDWVTPQYTLEDTEKVTFTNTLKEKNLEVEKKWIGGENHPDSIKFTVSATVEDGQGGRTPYAVKELTNTDGSDKEFTLSDANDWRHEIEHLPVNTPDGKFIFYDIKESQVDDYVLTGITDLTADEYNYCNVDVVKLWPDSNGSHTEVLRIVLKNSAGKYYAGVDSKGDAIFTNDQELASIYELKPGNNYTHRFDRLPYDDYTAEQLHKDVYSEGLATYRRAIIQYELENTPLEAQADPGPETIEPVIHKRIDALRDGVENPDSAHADEDLTDLYRLYLDYKIDELQDPNGVDLLFVIDHSGSMNSSQWPGNQYRAQAVESALNGDNGLISKFLAANDKNRWAAVGFKGPDGSRDYEWSLSNPWQPSTAEAATNAGQNGSEVLSSGNTFTRSTASKHLDNEGASILSNYTAGFWRAEQFLLDQAVKEDGRKKVIIFITDGVPTLHIDNLNGTLNGAGTAAGSPYYHEENGGCPDKALTEFGYFVNDMTGNGYTFGGDNGNMELYTIGLGASMQTAGGANLLNGLLSAAYSQNVPANHYMTVTDASGSSDESAANTLAKDLRIILGLNDTFSNLVIQDDLSKYVDLYGLADAGSDASAIMAAAKAKVTMTVPDPDDPDAQPQVITLYEKGAPATADNAKFTKADGTTKTTIIQELTYNASTKTVSAVFDPEYQPAGGVTYTLSFDVKATDTAYTTYATSGYDKYTSGDHQQVIVGDEDTDFLGTTPANATSSNKPGFRSNDEAKATYKHNNENEEKVYPHPVIQVAARADIVKIDESGAALESAKFNLYDSNYDASKTIEENASHLIEANLQSKKPSNSAGDDAVIRSGKLTTGTYYLVETAAPAGYDSLSGPVKITVTETNGIIQMTAEIAGKNIGNDKLVKISNYGVWKLSVQNSSGIELPSAGGPGTTWIYLLGSMLLLGCGIVLVARRRIKLG